MKNRYLYLLIFQLLLSACSFSIQNKHSVEEEECHEAKALLQGLWVDDKTESPLFKVVGDSIYYADASFAPVAFKIIDDSLKTYGSRNTCYHIKKQGKHVFWIQSIVGDIIRLSKADSEMDSTLFAIETQNYEPLEVVKEVIQKDKVVYYNNIRYHGYAFINPTQIKIYLSEVTEEGMEMDNVYYDNIIHICVYQGTEKLFGKDVRKQDFEQLIPANYFQHSILSDMDFIGVDAKGYHYQATVSMPNSMSNYLIDLFITHDEEISYELVL